MKKRNTKTLWILNICLLIVCIVALTAVLSNWTDKPLSENESGLETSAKESPAEDTTIGNKPVSIRVSMVGDILLHTGPVGAASLGNDRYDFKPFFEEVKPHFEQSDLTIANLEGPVDAFGDNEGISSYPYFNFPLEILDAIKYADIDVVVNTNNHSFDKGWNGLVNTRKNLIAAGIEFTGTCENEEQYNSYYVTEVKGIKIGIVSWTALDNGNSVMSSMKPHLAYAMRQFNQETADDAALILKDVEKLRENGAQIVIAALHWGAEYQDEPSVVQKKIAKELTAGGVDIIYGHHSHCVQPIEVHKVERDGVSRDALVIYSTGNFMVDQIALNRQKTQEGIIVDAVIKDDGDGVAYIDSYTYTPTLCYRDAIWAENGQSLGYRVLPVSVYENMSEKPNGLSSNVWQKCKSAMARVPGIIGDAVPVYYGE